MSLNIGEYKLYEYVESQCESQNTGNEVNTAWPCMLLLL